MSRSAARGVTLVELVVFIVIVGVAMAGVFAAFNTMTAASADPQVRKQMLAIAESLMEEIQLMPFTFCDPDDPAAPTATGTGDCATVEGLGAEGGETRYTTPQFDNVSDYHGFSMGPGIQDIGNNTITGLGGYSASVTITLAGLGSGVNAIAAADALLISITVTHSGQNPIQLDGYRTRYAPNSLP
ncbi:MAG: type II secretion system protein [Pseudomonadota bacterium]